MAFELSIARVVALVGALTFALPIVATARPSIPDLESAGWRVIAFPGIAETRFFGRPEGVIEVNAMDSSALLFRSVPSAQRNSRYLSWRWRVDKSTHPSDLTVKGRDDRPIALHIWFPDDSASASLP